MIAPTATHIPLNSLILSGISFAGNKNAIRDYERNWSKYLGIRYSFAMTTGRSCLYIILEILKAINSRKEVIIPANICESVYQTVKRAGLRPVLVDVDLNSLNIEPDYIQNVINNNTLAVILAYLYGIPSDVVTVKKICKKQGVYLIEDVAQASGNFLSGQKLGTFGDFAFFSFGKSKPFTTINGGLLTTNNEKYAKLITKYINDHVKDRSILYDLFFLVKIIIYKFSIMPVFYGLLHKIPLSLVGTGGTGKFQLAKLSKIQALLGNYLLSSLNKMNVLRRKKANYLITNLKNEKNLTIPKKIVDYNPFLMRLPIIIKSSAGKEKIYKELLKNGIKASYSPNSLKNACIEYETNLDNYENSKYLKDHLLTIPIHYYLDEKGLKSIITILKTTVI